MQETPSLIHVHIAYLCKFIKGHWALAMLRYGRLVSPELDLTHNHDRGNEALLNKIHAKSTLHNITACISYLTNNTDSSESNSYKCAFDIGYS